MRLATTTADFAPYTKTQGEALSHIRAAGFLYADYSFCTDHARRDGVYAADFADYIKSISRTARRLGIRLVQAHAPMGPPFEDGGALLADTLRCIDACAAWGIPNIVVHSGYRRGLSRDDTLEENRKFYLPLLARAEQYGVNILTENFNKICLDGYYWIDNATDLLHMVEHVGHPLFHAVLDVGHQNLQGTPQDEAIRLLGRHLYALHIQDNLGDYDSHLTPFLGTLNMDEVMTGLADIGYCGYFTFEVGRVFAPPEGRRAFPRSTRLAAAPLALRDAYERYLYELGRCVLTEYGCFEE